MCHVTWALGLEKAASVCFPSFLVKSLCDKKKTTQKQRKVEPVGQFITDMKLLA